MSALSKAAAALETEAMNDHGVKWAQVKGHPFWCVRRLSHPEMAVPGDALTPGATGCVLLVDTPLNRTHAERLLTRNGYLGDD